MSKPQKRQKLGSRERVGILSYDVQSIPTNFLYVTQRTEETQGLQPAGETATTWRPSYGATDDELRNYLKGATDVVVVSHGWNTDDKDYIDFIHDTMTAMAKAENIRGTQKEGRPPLDKLRFVFIKWDSKVYGIQPDSGKAKKGAAPAQPPNFFNLTDQQIEKFEADDDEERKWYHDKLAEPRGKAQQVTKLAAAPPEAKIPSFTDVQNDSTFWEMKARAYEVGNTAVVEVIRHLGSLMPNGIDGASIHLLGHSFGCIVVSEALRKIQELGAGVSQIGAIVLVQGALSCYAFSTAFKCTYRPWYSLYVTEHYDAWGTFHEVTKNITGPLLVTTSENDEALPYFYWAVKKISGVVQDVGSRPSPLRNSAEVPGYNVPQWQEALGLRGIVSDDAFEVVARDIERVKCRNEGAVAVNQSYPEFAQAPASGGLKQVFVMRGDNKYGDQETRKSFIASHGDWKNEHVAGMFWEAFEASHKLRTQ